MSGFPTRLTRQILGPTLRDTYPVENPEIGIPASAFNTLFHQVAGLNLVSFARAIVVAEWNGSDFDIPYQEEAWNTRGLQSRPTLARTGTGNYTYTFASTYKNELDVDVTTALVASRASLRTQVTAYANRREIFTWIDPAAPLVVEVRIFDSSGTAQDEPFILEVM